MRLLLYMLRKSSILCSVCRYVVVFVFEWRLGLLMILMSGVLVWFRLIMELFDLWEFLFVFFFMCMWWMRLS